MLAIRFDVFGDMEIGGWYVHRSNVILDLPFLSSYRELKFVDFE